MANLNDLALNAESIDDVDVETVPLFGGILAPPQPGVYLFRLPEPDAIFNCFEIEETADQGQCLRALFQDDSALWNVTLNQPYHARISKRVRYIKVNDPDNPGEKKSVAISDMAQLLRVVDSIPEFKTNTGYGEALVKAGGRTFLAEHTLQATCSKTRDIYRDGALVKGKKGCGLRYETAARSGPNHTQVLAIPSVGGKFAIRFTCGNCQAELRCWGQLRSFKKVKK